MNRKILFRAKHIHTGEWIFGPSILFFPDGEVYIYPEDGLDSPDSYRVDPKTLGQYTGLQDKNGVKIFEGDIVGSDTQGFGVVEFHKEKLMYCLKYKSIDGELLFLRELSPIDFIIGNIHDNPELL